MTRPAMFRSVTPSRVAADGGSHYSRPLHLRWCVRCAADVPSAGGHWRGTLFICANHAPPKPLALVPPESPPEAPAVVAPESAFNGAPRHALDLWLRPGNH